jgi:hypothetical protein
MNGKGGPPLDVRPQRPTSAFSLALPLSVLAHVAVLAALLWLHTGTASRHSDSSPILVNVVDVPEPEPEQGPTPAAEPEPSGPPDTTQADASASQATVVPTPQPEPQVQPSTGPVEASEEAPPPDNSDVLSDADIAGAVSADNDGGGGGGGIGGCNTARALQQALQRNPLVHRAVMDADRSGKAVMLWNGDWVRSGAQDGKGLSGVREAILWELAFAPEACRNIRVQGLVLLSLADGTRFAIGSTDWRWSDLLGLDSRRRFEGPTR